MKVYTLIASFNIGNYDDFNECWIANYQSKEDALEAFRFKLGETNCLDEDGKATIDGEKETVEELFNFLLANGCCYDGYNGSEKNRWFVRGEEVQEKFDKEVVSWD